MIHVQASIFQEFSNFKGIIIITAVGYVSTAVFLKGNKMNLYQRVELLESMRKRILFGLFVFIPFIVVGFMALCYMFLILEAILFLVIMLFIGFLYYCVSGADKFKKMYKETFLTELLSEIFENVDYRWNRGFVGEEIDKMGLNKVGNIVESEDYLSAKYNGIRFEQADVKIADRKKTGRNGSVVVQYFKGRMFKFYATPKTVPCVQVFSDNYRYRGEIWDNFKLHKVEMEGIDFNKNFDVFAARDVDAFYVLTPAMMERIDSLRRKHGNIAFNFYRNHIYVAYNDLWRDAFDADFKHEISYPHERAKMESEVQDIIDIIETIGIEKEN